MISGFVLIDKPGGLTSQTVVTAVKRTLGAAKAGHAGTLDPTATGLLIVGLGSATRLLGYVMGRDKSYDATIRLGQATTTDDAEGEPLGERVSAAALTEADITAAMARFTGAIGQVPSAVSAIKVGGRRAYALARAGEAVELTPRAVTITRFDLRAMESRDGWLDLMVSVDCSSGTYIRALARDLGAALGTGGHVTTLRRTRVGGFSVADATDLEAVSAADVRPLEDVAADLFPVVVVGAATARETSYGRPVPVTLSSDLTALVGPGPGGSERLLALYRPDGPVARPVVVFPGPPEGSPLRSSQESHA